VVDQADGNGIEEVQLRAADPVRRDEPRFLEDTEVLHHAEAGHVERALDLPERLAVPLEETVEDRAPGWVCQGPEDRLLGGVGNRGPFGNTSHGATVGDRQVTCQGLSVRAVKELLEDDVAADPLEQFRRWFAEASDDNRMALATAAPDGSPSVRMVLLKGADEQGFVFFTGYESRKGGELEVNPRAALLFHWPQLRRQVRIEGRVERVSREESDAYFATRPRGAQLAAAASRQGRVLANRAQLDEAAADLEREHADRDVPRPGHWGGYR